MMSHVTEPEVGYAVTTTSHLLDQCVRIAGGYPVKRNEPFLDWSTIVSVLGSEIDARGRLLTALLDVVEAIVDDPTEIDTIGGKAYSVSCESFDRARTLLGEARQLRTLNKSPASP